MIFDDFALSAPAIAIFAIVLWISAIYLKTPKNLPPGPREIPFLGYLPFLTRKPHLAFTKLQKKYGDIFTISIAKERVVVLSSFKLIKEAFQQSDKFMERPNSFSDLLTFDSIEGMLGNGGAQRKELRHFSLSTLRQLGMGKASLEPKIQDEILYLVNSIKNLGGKPAYLRDMIKTSITNIMCTIMYGNRLDYNNDEFQQLLQLSNNFVSSLGIDKLSQYLPEFLINLLGITKPKDFGTMLYRKILNEVQKYDKIHDGVNSQLSFIDAWRTEAEKPNSNTANFNEKKLAKILSELFIAGSHTTSTTLQWALLYLTKYPNVQTKLQKEIDDVIGKERQPSMTDQKLMPYTQATILELNRIISLAPLLTPHCSTDDTTLAGYFIPKDTTIHGNVWAIHHNPELFPEPECFKPERFLTEDNKVTPIEESIPFSIGKRVCVGEALARMQLFLYITTFLQHFSFTSSENVSFDYIYAIVLEPLNQKICATMR
uniref:Cytochrome P450 n=1 Tax=Strigamia maritima TaxID=126957 RepID=T1JMZ1_STRMM